ncbi:MAG TPA: hypothetical protein PLS20_07525 [Ruminococcus flavefaciens]|nr:hypothetical protein [Ruminococcus flavefaciens]
MGNSENTVKKTNKVLIFMLIAAVVVIAVIALAVLNSIYKRQFGSYVNSMNSGAANTFKVMKQSDEFAELLNGAEEGGDCFIFGDRSDGGAYVAYQRAFVAKDTLIFGSPYSEASTYWAARVVDKKVTEVWFSEFPLEQNDLHTYSFDEQIAEYRFLQKFSKSGVIGYYRSANAV